MAPIFSRAAPSALRGWTAGALALGGVTLLLGAASVWGLAAPASPIKRVLPLASAHEAAANALLASPTGRTAAAAEAREALAQGPARAVNWLQIAYAQAGPSGRLDARGREALSRSYTFQPYGPEVSQWRLSFAFDHWGELTPELREQVLGEAEVLWRTSGHQRVERGIESAQTRNGRAAGALLRLKLKALDRK